MRRCIHHPLYINVHLQLPDVLDLYLHSYLFTTRSLHLELFAVALSALLSSALSPPSNSSIASVPCILEMCSLPPCPPPSPSSCCCSLCIWCCCCCCLFRCSLICSVSFPSSSPTTSSSSPSWKDEEEEQDEEATDAMFEKEDKWS